MAKSPNQTKIDDLYFGVVVDDFNAHGTNDFLRTINLFDSSRVKWSVAYWVASDDEFKKKHELIYWCFGDVWGRCEYEFIVCHWPFKDEATVDECGMKVDVFRMYVKPNAKILEEMVNSVSVTSAKKYLSEERKRRGKNGIKR